MAFVAAFDKSTGRKHSVPEHYLGHPVLGRNLSKTPRTQKAEREAEKATTKTKTPAAGDDKKES